MLERGLKKTGSEKERLVVVNKSKSPHCFSRIRYDLQRVCDWYANKTA